MRKVDQDCAVDLVASIGCGCSNSRVRGKAIPDRTLDRRKKGVDRNVERKGRAGGRRREVGDNIRKQTKKKKR